MKPFVYVVLAAISLLSACSKSPAPVKAVKASLEGLETVSVIEQQVAKEIAFDGVIEAVNRAVVSAQTGGRVTELPFDVGDYVAKGDVIARFTDSEQKAALQSAQAGREEARAKLAEATQQHTRIEEMYNKKLVAKAQYDQSIAQLKSANARVEAAQAAVADAEQRLKYTVVIAPYAGIVVKRLTDVGATVAPGTPLLEGVSLEHLRVKVAIPQQHIGPLRKHKKARVVLNSGQSLSVESLRLPPSADLSTHSFNVLLDLPPGDHGLFPGTLTKVVFVSGQNRSILVPNTAVAYRGELTGIYAVNESRLEFRYIRLGSVLANNKVPVLSGLTPGESIALDPVAAAVVYKQQFVKPKE